MATDFGGILREHRLRLGWTQEDLAARSGVSTHAISVLESGKRRPRLSSVGWLADALGLAADDRETLFAAAAAASRAKNAAQVKSAGEVAGDSGADGTNVEEPAELRGLGRSRCRLPADTRLFTGRTDELEQVLDLARKVSGGADPEMLAISAIDGMGGVGKSALAVHAAHRIRPLFPDGQLFVDLRGHAASAEPLRAEDVLDGLLNALGVPPQLVPTSLEERAALYRDRLADTRTLIVLDNALSTAQVRPLLPGTPGCLVIVTSRRRLTGLDDAHILALDTLTAAEAAALLHKAAGPGRIPDRDPQLDELVALCGALPLAVRIVGARLRHRRSLLVENLVEQLRDDGSRLDQLSDEDRALTAVFDSSYHALPAAEQQLFRRLGLVPGPDFDAHAAAHLIGTDPRGAERLLDALLDHNLLSQYTPGRYRFHDLVGLYASGQTLLPQERPEHEAAWERLLNHYLRTAQQADRHLTLYSRPVRTLASGTAITGPVHLRDREQALSWMRAERDNLLAAVGAAPAGLAVALSASTASLLLQDGPWPQAAQLHQNAADLARRTGDRAGEAGALGDLSRVRNALGDLQSSYELAAQALDVFRGLGDRHGEAAALDDAGRARYMLGDFGTARELLQASLELYRELGDALGQANTLWGLGRVCNAEKAYGPAASMLEQALTLFDVVGGRQGEANALWDLSRVRRAAGDVPESERLLERALQLVRSLGNRQSEANMLWSLGQTRAAADRDAAAAEAFEQALSIYLELGKRDGEAHCLKDLGRLRLTAGDSGTAARLLQQAVDVFGELGLRYAALNALHDLGRARQQNGDYETAAELFEQARAFNREIGDSHDEAKVLTSMAELAAVTGRPDEELTCLQEALPLYRQAGLAAAEAGSELEEARALEGAARALAATGARSQAVTELRRAVALYGRLEAAELPAAATYLDILTSGDRS